MVDSADDTNPAIIIADRGYEFYNIFAHIQEKNWKFKKNVIKDICKLLIDIGRKSAGF